jgi:hypothetical protein
MKADYPFLKGLSSDGFLIGLCGIAISTVGIAVRDQPVEHWLRAILPYSPALLIAAGLIATSIAVRKSHKKEDGNHQQQPRHYR